MHFKDVIDLFAVMHPEVMVTLRAYLLYISLREIWYWQQVQVLFFHIQTETSSIILPNQKAHLIQPCPSCDHISSL